MTRLLICMLLISAGLATAGCKANPPENWEPYGPRSKDWSGGN